MVIQLAKKHPPATTIIVKDGKFKMEIKIGEISKVTELPLDGTVIEEEKIDGNKYKVS